METHGGEQGSQKHLPMMSQAAITKVKVLVPQRGLKAWELTKSSITLSSEEEFPGEASCETVNRNVFVSKDFNDDSRVWFDDNRLINLPSFFARFR